MEGNYWNLLGSFIIWKIVRWHASIAVLIWWLYFWATTRYLLQVIAFTSVMTFLAEYSFWASLLRLAIKHWQLRVRGWQTPKKEWKFWFSDFMPSFPPDWRWVTVVWHLSFHDMGQSTLGTENISLWPESSAVLKVC